MLLDDLTGVIESLRKRIGTHRASLGENETRTRMALVDPLLMALGWDVSDPDVVTPEFKVSGGWADYALLRTDERPAATVEAKKLGEPLASHRMQMLNYANASGIDFAALTDGDHWELYDVFRRGTLEERRMLDVSIGRDPVHEVALKLLLLWRTNLTSDELVQAGAPNALEAPHRKTPTVEAEQPARPESPDWVPLSRRDPPFWKSLKRHPTALRFWDGSERSLGHWNEVLTMTIEKLHSDGRLKVDDVPIPPGRQTYIVNTEPVHPTGKRFGESKRINGTPLSVNLNLNFGQVRQNTRRILQHYGLDSGDVYLQVEQ